MSDWNQFRGNPQHTGVRLEYGGPDGFEEDWVVELGTPVGCSPVVDRGVVYVGTERGDLYAIDGDRGSRRWVADGTAAVTTPVVTADAVYVARTDGTVSALDVVTGDVRWEYDATAPLESDLTLAEGLLLVGDGAGVVALEAETGKLRWRAERESEADGDEPGDDSDRSGDDSAESEDETEDESIEPAVGSPAVGDGRVYVGLRNGGVRALDLETGVEVWRAPTDGTVVDGPTFVGGETPDDDRVYVADDDGTLLALAPETGQTWFTYEIRDAFTSGPTVLEETIFLAAADGYLHVTDTTFGNRKLRGLVFSKKGLALDGVARSGAVVVGDVVLVGDSRGRIYAIDADEPDFLWQYPLETPITTTPAVDDGRLFVGCEDDRLYCLRWDRNR